ncbi:MAG: OmpA family protein [Bacteroidales bacterium]
MNQLIHSPGFKLFCIALILLSGLDLFSQKPTAPVKVEVTDMKGKPRSGETIIFIDTVSKKQFSGVSDARGQFKLQLPAGAVYLISIKAVGDDTDHSTIAIPDLKPGEYFDGETVVTIKFEPAKSFILDAVYFDSGKATLRPESYTELNELVEYLKLKPSVKIEIAGHTDSVGDDDANLKLSQSRADAVKAYLIKKGIASSRVVAKGYGETRPVADNETPEGRQKNRRTEVNILSE